MGTVKFPPVRGTHVVSGRQKAGVILPVRVMADPSWECFVATFHTPPFGHRLLGCGAAMNRSAASRPLLTTMIRRS